MKLVTPKNYPELEKLVAEILEANEYARWEIMAANLFNALAAHDLHVVAGEATEGMWSAMHDADGLRTGYPTLFRAALKANPLRKDAP